MNKRQCLFCGMTVSFPQTDFKEEKESLHCPKCDSDLLGQTDGSCLTRDIAHHRESISEALNKLDELLNEGHAGAYQKVRAVVGGGVIKDEVLRQLYFYQQNGFLLSYVEEGHNQGAVLIQIRTHQD